MRRVLLTTKRKPATVGEILVEEFMRPMGLTQAALTQAALAEAGSREYVTYFLRKTIGAKIPRRQGKGWWSAGRMCLKRLSFFGLLPDTSAGASGRNLNDINAPSAIRGRKGGKGDSGKGAAQTPQPTIGYM